MTDHAGIGLMVAGLTVWICLGLYLLVTHLPPVPGMAVAGTIFVVVGYLLATIEPPPIRYR